MSNGRYPTVSIAEQPLSFGAKTIGRVDEKILLCALENRLGGMEH